MKQSSIEWLVWKFATTDIEEFKDNFNEFVNQAKEMEKEQIFDAWENGFREFYDGSSTPEEYYNTTFIVKP
jgi:hypothetical protein